MNTWTVDTVSQRHSITATAIIKQQDRNLKISQREIRLKIRVQAVSMH